MFTNSTVWAREYTERSRKKTDPKIAANLSFGFIDRKHLTEHLFWQLCRFTLSFVEGFFGLRRGLCRSRSNLSERLFKIRRVRSGSMRRLISYRPRKRVAQTGSPLKRGPVLRSLSG